MTDLTGAAWRKGTRSGDNGGNCVEVAMNLAEVVAVRDSKDSTGPLLTFTTQAWTDFIAAAKRGGRVS
ncbi:DUF397 domain-containing protein [Micromonospora ureilytica]|uniref:DUF397 domain-containing protein n=1 Tax=Micromonospora ureilytica TaxID=709868 RepID=A0A3N9XRR2_9ACTN|nr:DUF397 domain-containing protein [Micromonospora ureilytica]RQX15798.1 DUF397 domain-containing protein [Micromonospora ureilytica]